MLARLAGSVAGGIAVLVLFAGPVGAAEVGSTGEATGSFFVGVGENPCGYVPVDSSGLFGVELVAVDSGAEIVRVDPDRGEEAGRFRRDPRGEIVFTTDVSVDLTFTIEGDRLVSQSFLMGVSEDGSLRDAMKLGTGDEPCAQDFRAAFTFPPGFLDCLIDCDSGVSLGAADADPDAVVDEVVIDEVVEVAAVDVPQLGEPVAAVATVGNTTDAESSSRGVVWVIVVAALAASLLATLVLRLRKKDDHELA